MKATIESLPDKLTKPFRRLQRIPAGSAPVYMGTYGDTYAIEKVFYENQPESVEQFWNERAVLRRLAMSCNEWLNCYLGIGYNDWRRQMSIYLELLDDRDMILNHRFTNVKQFLYVLEQIFTAVYIIHANDVAHLDLHEGNILVHKSTDRVNIIDFGISALRSDPSQPKRFREFLKGNHNLPYPYQNITSFDALQAFDVWRLGTALVSILCGDTYTNLLLDQFGLREEYQRAADGMEFDDMVKIISNVTEQLTQSHIDALVDTCVSNMMLKNLRRDRTKSLLTRMLVLDWKKRASIGELMQMIGGKLPSVTIHPPLDEPIVPEAPKVVPKVVPKYKRVFARHEPKRQSSVKTRARAKVEPKRPVRRARMKHDMPQEEPKRKSKKPKRAPTEPKKPKTPKRAPAETKREPVETKEACLELEYKGHKVKNPKTGRWAKVSGSVGKSVIQKNDAACKGEPRKSTKPVASKKSAKSTAKGTSIKLEYKGNKVRNPETRRWVNIDGRIGRHVIAKYGFNSS